MAVTVQFDHHATIEGVSYIPGMVVALPELTVQPLIFAGRVHVVGQGTPITAPGVPTGADPYPQYLLPSELENALPGRLSQASLNSTFAALLANYTPTGGGGGGSSAGGTVLDNLDGTATTNGVTDSVDNDDGTANVTAPSGGSGNNNVVGSTTDEDALVTRAFELSVAYMRDYFSGA